MAPAVPNGALRVAFVVGAFPLLSETFIIDQIADLDDRGLDVDIYSFTRGDEAFVSQRYFDHDMGARVRYLDYPLSKPKRFAAALPKAWRMLRAEPAALLRSLDVRRYGAEALSLKLLHWAEPFSGLDYDVVHCHFGYVARDFVRVREVARISGELITTFYGVDVSKIFREQPASYYDRLRAACSLYFVMSEDMKRRVVAHGFPADQVRVHPVSIDVDAYPFKLRELLGDEPLRLAFVGRFVEKKGADDLLRALAAARETSPRELRCAIIGGGPLDAELRELHASLELGETATFEGFVTVENMLALFGDRHALVQPSKTAANGDME